MEKPVWRTRKRAFGALRACAIIASVGLFAIGRVVANFDILLISCLLVHLTAHGKGLGGGGNGNICQLGQFGKGKHSDSSFGLVTV